MLEAIIRLINRWLSEGRFKRKTRATVVSILFVFRYKCILCFTTHVIKVKNRNHSKTKFKNLGYDR